ncbi:hypothetical protein [Desulfurobacterium sp.]
MLRVERGSLVAKAEVPAGFSRVPHFLSARNPNLKPEDIKVEPFSGSIRISSSFIELCEYMFAFYLKRMFPAAEIQLPTMKVVRERNISLSLSFSGSSLLFFIAQFNGDFENPHFRRSVFAFDYLKTLSLAKAIVNEVKKNDLMYAISERPNVVLLRSNDETRLINTTFSQTITVNDLTRFNLVSLLESYVLSQGLFSDRIGPLQIDRNSLRVFTATVPLSLPKAFTLKEILQ